MFPLTDYCPLTCVFLPGAHLQSGLGLQGWTEPLQQGCLSREQPRQELDQAGPQLLRAVQGEIHWLGGGRLVHKPASAAPHHHLHDMKWQNWVVCYRMYVVKTKTLNHQSAWLTSKSKVKVYFIIGKFVWSKCSTFKTHRRTNRYPFHTHTHGGMPPGIWPVIQMATLSLAAGLKHIGLKQNSKHRLVNLT